MRRLIALLAAVACAAATTAARGEDDSPGVGITGALTCIAPRDATGIDAALARAASPLAGEGRAFVAAGTREGIDPRFLVAIAAHETLLETYAPARLIRNPFGIGPGWTFGSHELAISAAARILNRYYLSEGLIRIPDIARKWAPVGAVNDPTNLNQHWTSGVGTYYTALGGDPDRPVSLFAQDPTPACPSAVEGPGVVTPWAGTAPAVTGTGIYDGGDPATGLPATIPGFVFPLAPPERGVVLYDDEFKEPGAPGCFGQAWRCSVTLRSASGTIAVAAAQGTLMSATQEEHLQGVGFWLDTGRERIGYGPLLEYAGGIGPGVKVVAGQPLGRAAATLLVAWERAGHRVNPYPLLSATRPGL